MKPKAYLASRYEDRERLSRIRDRLALEGVEVTSRWLNATHQKTEEVTDEDKRLWGNHDLEDVARADVLVIFSPPEFFRTGRGGRHVEVGYALALGKPIILVGERENIFHWQEAVHVVVADHYLDHHIKEIVLRKNEAGE